MTQTLETWYISTLAAKLNATDITCTVATAPTVTAWRMHIYKWNTHAWIKYTGVAWSTLTGVSFVSKTADPATAVPWTTFPAWTSIELVEMHDQMLDKQEGWTIAGDITHTGKLTASKSITVPVYDDATARDVWIPTPTNWMIVYNTALWIHQQYISGAWASFATGSVVNADTTTAGKVELPTQAEIDARTDTGWSGANLAVIPSQLKLADSTRWIAGEAITANDFIYKEELQDYRIAVSEVTQSQTLKYAPLAIWDVTARTARSMKIIGNGVSSTTIKLGLKKTGAPVDNVTVRIETDTAWNPSWTLANANATGTVAGSGLTTTMIETTCTFAGAFTLTSGTVYHIVVWRSWGIDASNYYSIASYTTSARWFSTNLNGWTWGTASTTVMLSCTFAGTFKYLLCKTSASVISSCYFEWVALANYAIGETVYYTPQNTTLSTFSSLTPNTAYYLTNTAWTISTTPGTVTVYAGTADTTGSNLMIWSSENLGVYNNQLVWGWVFGTWAFSLLLKVKYPTTYTHLVAGWSWAVYAWHTKNGVSIANTTFTAVPWDIIYIAFDCWWSWPNVTLSEVVYSPRVQTI